MDSDDSERPSIPGPGHTPPRAPRARNRTVMLTPEMTGQMRAKVNEDSDIPLSDHDHDDGFQMARTLGNTLNRIGPPSMTPLDNELFGSVFDDPTEDATDRQVRTKLDGSEIEGGENGLYEESNEIIPRVQFDDRKDEETEGLETKNKSSEESSSSQSEEPSFLTHILQSPVTIPSASITMPQTLQNYEGEENREWTPPPRPVAPQRMPVAPHLPPLFARESHSSMTSRMDTTSVEKVKSPASREDFVRAAIVGFLVSYDVDPLGEVWELCVGRCVVTSDKTPGDCLFVDHPSVSPMHAVVRVFNSGEVQILDQLTDSGTALRRYGATEDEILHGEKAILKHGDVIRFGERSFRVFVMDRD